MKNSIMIAHCILVGMVVAGCLPSGDAFPDPTPTADRVTITVHGETIVLIPGENVSPEIFEAIKSPEILEHSDWVFVDGFWDLMPRGVTIPLEAEPPRVEPEASPVIGPVAAWESLSLEACSCSFLVPEGWQSSTTAVGMRLSPQDESFLVHMASHPNPFGASLPVWLAEFAPVPGGEVLESVNEALDGVPVHLQRVLQPAAGRLPAGEIVVLWIAHQENVLEWNAWPGTSPETVDLLRFIVSTLE